MTHVSCRDCGRKREAFRPIVRLLCGRVEFACRQCFKEIYYHVGRKLGLDEDVLVCVMFDEMSADDRVALARLR